MTRTFIDKETGEEFETCALVHENVLLNGIQMIQPKPKKPEPKIESGDWVGYLQPKLKSLDVDVVFIVRDGKEKNFDLVYVLEIRKANKEHWKKIDGEWVKL